MSKSAAEIIGDRGAQRIADALGVASANVRMWKKRNSIPPEHWRRLADERLATLEELADAAAHGEAA